MFWWVCDVFLRGDDEEDVHVEIVVLVERVASHECKVADMVVHAPPTALRLQASVEVELCAFALAGNAEAPCHWTFAG